MACTSVGVRRRRRRNQNHNITEIFKFRGYNNLLSALQRRLKLLKDSFDRESLHDTEHNIQ